uniref:MYND-type domain-containing protein n=1 Tax=Chlamydomonas leiostraca TaxID=1034604 RepID=A0A7S0WMQ2_9CHLO|mmetsp:Transcript_19364/g.49264  ORF Transcript_19364/g.49264 Transcript_19364/m.49264 type:complete len:456 (+) Transcript_19364:230-1597(+)|eukprot:CAMPEP_0202860464 /NCGR_PEP_ID=MMETSP1391-20130828/2149_1 /ASSEMBLY_ACC=CAM_ASM_000867 /TAXON_ID=1034604 /ORGANISM="Chlamydomonas leiostraca, Strain SAG 11-49" /LENGTH=455 /DNA_ID=CAMNT_0049539627 /DNA_START=230 /DNA_END=1597 /DNA_ORIENTATION=-
MPIVSGETPAGEDEEMTLMRALMRLPDSVMFNTLWQLAQGGGPRSDKTGLALPITKAVRTQLLPELRAQEAGPRGAGKMTEEQAARLLAHCERIPPGSFDALLAGNKARLQDQHLIRHPEFLLFCLTDASVVAARSAKHVRALQMCLLEDSSQELQRASKTVISGLRRMPASLKQQVMAMAVRGVQLGGGAVAGDFGVPVAVRLTEEVMSTLVPALAKDSRPLLKPETAQLLLDHCHKVREEEVAYMRHCSPSHTPWQPLLRPDHVTFLTQTPSGRLLDYDLIKHVPATPAQAAAGTAQAVDQLARVRAAISGAASLAAAKEAVGEPALLASGLPAHEYSKELQRRLKCRCNKCGATQEQPYMKCSKCKVMAYCGRECQVADWAAHKRDCKAIMAFGILLNATCSQQGPVGITAADLASMLGEDRSSVAGDTDRALADAWTEELRAAGLKTETTW